MRTRPLPAHSDGHPARPVKTGYDIEHAAAPDDDPRGAAQRRTAQQIEQDWTRRQRQTTPDTNATSTVGANSDAVDTDDLSRSRRAADRAAALRTPPVPPAPRR